MNTFKSRIAVLVFAVGVAGGLMAAPAFGEAFPNQNGANCFGVIVSTHTPIAQTAADLGMSVHDLHFYAEGGCP